MFRRRKESDFQTEIESHIRLETDRLIAEGMSPGEARDAARRAFGSPTAVAERFHDSRSFAWLEQLSQDVTYGLRNLRQSPGFAAVAIVSLALGIGVNIAAFGLLDALLIRLLPVPNPEELRIIRWIRTDDAPVRSHSGYTIEDAGGQPVSGSVSYSISSPSATKSANSPISSVSQTTNLPSPPTGKANLRAASSYRETTLPASAPLRCSAAPSPPMTINPENLWRR